MGQGLVIILGAWGGHIGVRFAGQISASGGVSVLKWCWGLTTSPPPPPLQPPPLFFPAFLNMMQYVVQTLY